MFEKLTPRERKLAYGVMGLLPIAILFIGVFTFINKYNANGTKEVALTTQVGDENLRMANGKKANRRRAYYNSISLPSDLESFSNDYQNWLKGLVRDELQMTYKSLAPSDAGDLKYERDVFGNRKKYKLSVLCDLNQLTEFLARFYSVEALHRINSMVITAQNEVASNEKKIRTGQLSITMDIEVLALGSATDQEKFIDKFRPEEIAKSQLAQANQAFKGQIVHRDIFGPPNNIPTITIRPSTSYKSETDARISFTAKDADEEDQLVYELIEKSVEGATLEPSSEGARTGRLVVPGQKAGRYSFKVKVADNGFPAKETIEEFTVLFEDPVIAKNEPKEPDPPPFENAKQTKVTSFVLEKDGSWRVWINVRTTGEQFRLKVGESFALDEKKWLVDSIDGDARQAVLRVDDKLLSFKIGDQLAKPRDVVELTPGAEEKPDEQGVKSELESDAAPKPRVDA